MDMTKLADEIIAGRRIIRQDDLRVFLTCDLKELLKGADMVIPFNPLNHDLAVS